MISEVLAVNATLKLTNHAKQRFAQRSFFEADVDLILEFATEVGPDCLIVRDREVEEAIAKRRREIGRLEKLRRCKLVTREGVVITAFKASPKQCSRALRGTPGFGG